ARGHLPEDPRFFIGHDNRDARENRALFIRDPSGNFRCALLGERRYCRCEKQRSDNQPDPQSGHMPPPEMVRFLHPQNERKPSCAVLDCPPQSSSGNLSEFLVPLALSKVAWFVNVNQRNNAAGSVCLRYTGYCFESA